MNPPDRMLITIRALTRADRDAALAVIRSGAQRYRDFRPQVDFGDSGLTAGQWDTLCERLTWYGAFIQGALVGVMALEYVRDVALLRHAYVLPTYQRQRIAMRLGEALEARIRGIRRIIVWTYAGNYKARRGLEQAGYTLVADSEAVLRAYLSLPEDRLKAAVAYEKPVPANRRPQEVPVSST